MTMQITEAIRQAQHTIDLGFLGGQYYVHRPFRLDDPAGPSLAPCSTMTYWAARAAVRRTRVEAVIYWVTGDSESADLATQHDRDPGGDWRQWARAEVARWTL